MSEIRSKLDPNNTLPIVQFRSTPSSFTEVLDEDGYVIGNFTTIDKDGSTHFVTIELEDDETIRGKGYGLAIYTQVIENTHARGFTFESHPKIVSEKAKTIWDRFVREKLAQEIEPFKMATYIDIEGQMQPHMSDGRPEYSGLYRIPPPEKT
jgi:hypothetical protein